MPPGHCRAHVGLWNFIPPSCTVLCSAPWTPSVSSTWQVPSHATAFVAVPCAWDMLPTTLPRSCFSSQLLVTFSGADLPFSVNLSRFGRFPVYALSIYNCCMCSLPCLLLFFSMALVIVSCPSCFIYSMCSLSPTNGVNSDRARIFARVTRFCALVHRRCSVNVCGTKK